jgi:4-hydroxyphenylacetate 3-hydroxylase C terminal
VAARDWKQRALAGSPARGGEIIEDEEPDCLGGRAVVDGYDSAKTTNIDQHLHVQGMLAELFQYTEFCPTCVRASEADAAPSPSSG